MKKTFLAIILCACLLCIFSSCGGEDSASTNNEFKFAENGDGYTLTRLGTINSKEIVIPDTYNGKPVTAIGNQAFDAQVTYNISITSITLPETITRIGQRAFSCNYNLKSINIPASVTEIGEYAFSGCTSLEKVDFSEGVTEISKRAFSGCDLLSQITIPASVTKISEGAFEGCESLGKFTIPSTVTTIEHAAFYGVGEAVEISVSFDKEAPEGWAESCFDYMDGGKVFNTSEAYYDNVVIPAQAQKKELEAKAQECTDKIQELKDLIASVNKKFNSSNYADERSELNKQKRNYQERQDELANTRSEYWSQIAALPITNQIN